MNFWSHYTLRRLKHNKPTRLQNDPVGLLNGKDEGLGVGCTTIVIMSSYTEGLFIGLLVQGKSYITDFPDYKSVFLLPSNLYKMLYLLRTPVTVYFIWLVVFIW